MKITKYKRTSPKGKKHVVRRKGKSNAKKSTVAKQLRAMNRTKGTVSVPMKKTPHHTGRGSAKFK